MTDAMTYSSTKLDALKSTARVFLDEATSEETVLAVVTILCGKPIAQEISDNKPATRPQRKRSTQADALGILIRQSMSQPNKVTWTIDELYNPHRASPSMPQGEERGKKRINELLTRAAAHTFMRVPGDSTRWLLRKRYSELVGQ